MKKEFEFKLIESELKYQIGSEFIKATKLVLKAPSMRNERLADKLSQAVSRAFISAQKNLPENLKKEEEKKQEEGKNIDNEESISSDLIRHILLFSNIDIWEIKQAYKDLLFHGVCLIDGLEDKVMNQNYYELLSYQEAQSLMGEYLATFFMSFLHLGKK